MYKQGRHLEKRELKEMAKFFINQAKQYAAARPNYPIQLFEFIASKTPCHDLAWDVGTGSGQASRSVTMFTNLYRQFPVLLLSFNFDLKPIAGFVNIYLMILYFIC